MNARLPLKIHILESPSQEDLNLNRLEGNVLKASLELRGIPYSYAQVKSSDEFETSIDQLVLSCMQIEKDVPVLHLSAHGLKDGFGLTGGDVIGWTALEKSLIQLNQACSGLLVLCMSSCSGFAADGMARRDGDLPYFAIVGHAGSPSLQDFAIGFCSFYHLLALKGHDLQEAVEGMRRASGDRGFHVAFADETQKRWKADIEQLDIFRRVLNADNEVNSQGSA